MDFVQVLLRHTESYGGEKSVKVLGVYATHEALDERVARIAKSNNQYPMRRLGPTWWAIGPEEDEGFFGHRQVLLEKQEAVLYEEDTDG